jgi:hypothetical protein
MAKSLDVWMLIGGKNANSAKLHFSQSDLRP